MGKVANERNTKLDEMGFYEMRWKNFVILSDVLQRIKTIHRQFTWRVRCSRKNMSNVLKMHEFDER